MLLRPLGGELPAGVAHLRFRAVGVTWEGPTAGHGRLVGRRLTLEAAGKGAAGIEQLIEVEDDGEDAVRLVSRLAAPPVGRAAG